MRICRVKRDSWTHQTGGSHSDLGHLGGFELFFVDLRWDGTEKPKIYEAIHKRAPLVATSRKQETWNPWKWRRMRPFPHYWGVTVKSLPAGQPPTRSPADFLAPPLSLAVPGLSKKWEYTDTEYTPSLSWCLLPFKMLLAMRDHPPSTLGHPPSTLG